MTCRHGKDDTACSSHPSNVRREMAKEHAAEIAMLKSRLPATPDRNNYEIAQSERVGPHLILKVKYPNCANCSYEGVKVLVLLNASEAEALRWKVIDPHFRDPKVTREVNWAPAPAARFPATADGWADAVTYARGKVKA